MAPSPPPAVTGMPAVAPYHPPPAYPPPPTAAGTDLIAGPIAYFLGKGSRARIAESGGALGGAGTANAGRILGIITTAVGALVTLLWFVVILNALNDVSFGE